MNKIQGYFCVLELFIKAFSNKKKTTFCSLKSRHGRVNILTSKVNNIHSCVCEAALHHSKKTVLLSGSLRDVFFNRAVLHLGSNSLKNI